MYSLKTKTLKTKKNMHLSRKIFHSTSGVIMASLYEFWLSREVALLLLTPGFLVFFVAETFRINYPKHPLSILFFRLFARLARSYEIERRSGIVFYLAGVLACVLFFPKPIAVLSILFLAFGDPFASLCGMTWGALGPRFSNGKSLIGSLGGLVACSFITFLYFLRSLSPSLSLLAAIPETLCGRIVDGKGGPIDLDDNLAIPLGSSIIMFILFKLFPLVRV
ncbi:hypothetical protein GUITHDRAFT_116596 [Guillardia theta CCMP2712]|uniref:Phosphatidate cytidylyltransferase n=1 Tax=Guillardia theta (strain CCMP2712) TaxID=905079 RepID=L1IM36_GUITC|nr:hypothetical protein GUITHDRAFT_116596 [Guillardia theta CCMP2712]EKX37182.1 hypothetical protein GUITHDRAFT_116596 [Guillardia theta CCMP2712]|eukprot:XP_005824162.1 hypothetical protein GUITHDRAFT_116596 [Guillardia theta CCMP2712]